MSVVNRLLSSMPPAAARITRAATKCDRATHCGYYTGTGCPRRDTPDAARKSRLCNTQFSRARRSAHGTLCTMRVLALCTCAILSSPMQGCREPAAVEPNQLNHEGQALANQDETGHLRRSNPI